MKLILRAIFGLILVNAVFTAATAINLADKLKMLQEAAENDDMFNEIGYIPPIVDDLTHTKHTYELKPATAENADVETSTTTEAPNSELFETHARIAAGMMNLMRSMVQRFFC